MNFLLARRPEVNCQDARGKTPLHLIAVSSQEIGNTALIKMLLIKGANPFLTDIKGRTPLDYAKERLTDNPEFLKIVVDLLEDTMEVNKGFCKRLKGAFTLDQPVHKMQRSKKTMIGFFSTMYTSQFLMMTLIFPYLTDEREQWLKTTITSFFAVWMLLGTLLLFLDPGTIRKENVSMLQLIEEFEVQEICSTCSILILPRSRHCNICDRCIDRLDHHC